MVGILFSEPCHLRDRVREALLASHPGVTLESTPLPTRARSRGALWAELCLPQKPS